MATQPNLEILGVGAFGPQALPTLKPIPSAPGYLAGDDESIWSTRRGPLHPLKARKDKDGYPRVNLSIDGEHQTRTVHTLVAEAFCLEPLKGKELNHLDGRKHNNKTTNLEVTDRKGNARHAYKLGLLNPIGALNRLRADLKRLGVVTSSEQDEIMSLVKLRAGKGR